VATEQARTGGARADRPGSLQPADRRAAVHLPAHGEDPRPAHQRQARRAAPHPGRGPGQGGGVVGLSSRKPLIDRKNKGHSRGPCLYCQLAAITKSNCSLWEADRFTEPPAGAPNAAIAFTRLLTWLELSARPSFSWNCST